MLMVFDPRRMPMPRSLAVAALIGGAVLTVPLAPTLAQDAVKPPSHKSRALQHAETIEQRITELHAELKITQAEEPDWQAVAQAMRDNAAAFEKLVADKKADMEKGMTAIEDLQTYTQFAQARLDGLNKLTTAFQTLYDAMPDEQKKVADQVFQNARRQQQSSNAG